MASSRASSLTLARSAASRAYIPANLAAAVKQKLIDGVKSLKMGTVEDFSNFINAVIDERSFSKIKSYLDKVRQDPAAEIWVGGECDKSKGYFVQPTIVGDIADDARLVKEEQFGPILPVLRYSDVDDAIARVNDTDFGLGGSVWSKDLDRAHAVAARIDSGTVWINQHLDMHPEVPFSGAKQSGVGTELGQEGLHEFTRAKIINMAT